MKKWGEKEGPDHETQKATMEGFKVPGYLKPG